jgi:hypothetical protein
MIFAGLAIAEEPPSLDLPPGFGDGDDDDPPDLDLPSDLLCGNGEVDAGEVCDDGNTDGNDECKANCSGCGSGYELDGDECVEEDDGGGSGGSTVKKQCNDNKDNDNDGKKDYPADPGCSSKTDNSETDPTSGTVKITEAKVFPVGFNPLMTYTVISYKLSLTGVVELEILDESGVKVITLVNNEETNANELYEVSWHGKSGTNEVGPIVAPGKYFFKIKAKTSSQSVASDTKTGEINVIYGTDFEDELDSGDQGSFLSINNNPPNQSSGTGPETAIYLVFPVIGYFATRYLNRK